MKRYICIDVGGTAIKYGLIDENGTIRRRSEIASEAYKGGACIADKVLQIIKEMTEYEPDIHGIGVSTAGMVDCEKGEILYAGPTIPDYTGIKLKEIVESKTGILCEVENDVNCAGLAEWYSGAAKGSRSAVCLTVGTGIGGCIILDGDVFHGHSNSACEIGYMPMDGSDFQTLGAASIMTKKVAKAKGEEEQRWDGKHIFAEAKNGDAVCIQAIGEMCDILGRGIASVCYMLNPELIVLGGGIMAQREVLETGIREALERYLKPVIFENTKLVFAEHGNDAGMLGALCHFVMKQAQRKQIQIDKTGFAC